MTINFDNVYLKAAGAVAGKDEKDTTSVDIPKKDYTKSLKNDIKGKRIAVPKEFFGEGINAEVKATLEKAIEKYKELEENQKEFILREKLREIEKELGVEDPKKQEVEAFLNKLDTLKINAKTKYDNFFILTAPFQIKK